MAGNFEYLRAVGLGYYIPRESPLHQRDPRAKLLTAFFLLLSITLTQNPAGLLLGLVTAMVGFIVARLSPKYAPKGLITPLPFLLLIALIQIILHKPLPSSQIWFQLSFLKVYDTALLTAGMLILRFAALVLIISLSTSVISTLEIIYGLESLLKPLNKIGLPVDAVVMTVQIMLRFLPLLALRMEQISKSQASRGAEWDAPRGGPINRAKLFLPLIVPLFLGSLQQAERTTTAMLARGYGVSKQRSSPYEYRFNSGDVFFLLLAAILTGVILIPVDYFIKLV
ncbi:MAG TPA: energy-coupling factor transporter transmembrane protein EcfT [Anaerolineae bacterium]|nr:energy-coupling factor transporter transmembrane protein EcfT [Anaerolineae bacterium]